MTDADQAAWRAILEISMAGRVARRANDADAIRRLRGDLARVVERSHDPLYTACYANIVETALERPLVIGQIGQSLDGRIATPSGHSHYINGPQSLDHLHRLRALADAVIIGASTADLDDPRLTTRRVDGPNPVRVVIDPNGRVPSTRAVLSDRLAPSLVVRAAGLGSTGAPGYECLELASSENGISPLAVLAALSSRGYSMILVEGGAHTVSEFIAAGVIDRLHVLVAPLILGSGRSGLQLPPIDHVDEGLRPPARTFQLGFDMLFECDLAGCNR